MEFDLELKFDFKPYKMHVRRISVDARNERFEVTGGRKSIVVEINRPLFRNKGLKHRKPDSNLVDCSVKHPGSLSRLYDAMLETIEWIEKIDS